MNSTNHSSEAKNNSYSEQEQSQSIDLSNFINSFFKFWWLCIILAVLAAGIMFVKNYVLFTPQYQTSVTFTVQTPPIGFGNIGTTSYSFSYNRSTAAQLSNTFPNIIKSNILQDVVCNDLGLTYFPCSLSASAVTGTNMFTITATGNDPQITYDVLMSVIKNYPTVAQYVIGDTNLDILTEPTVPTSPSNQFAYRSQIVKFALAGFAIGLVWIVVYTMMRQTICSRSEIRTKLNQHCLGVLPEVTFKKYNKDINRSIILTNPMIGDNYLESFRALRNSLINSAADSKIIMLTSAAPGEGKTSASINLALSLAMMNKKVLIIDADLRNPNVSTYFGVKNTADDANNAHIAKISQLQINTQFSVSILNFNTSKYSIWKIIEVNYLSKLIEQLRPKYDYIIVDTSPLGITSEPEVIAQVVDAAILVIKKDTIRTSRIVSLIDTLLSADVKILGCILNGVQTGMAGYGGYGSHYGRYSYGYRYGYGYGYGYGEKRRKNIRTKSEKE